MITFTLIWDAVRPNTNPVYLEKSNRTGQRGTATTVQIKGVTGTMLILSVSFLFRVALFIVVLKPFLKTFFSIGVNEIIFPELVLVLVNYNNSAHKGAASTCGHVKTITTLPVRARAYLLYLLNSPGDPPAR